MTWRNYFSRSKEATRLEDKLAPKVIEHSGGLKSTANTDIEHKVINLDVSQEPLKCALSYSYELKNLENSEKYALLNTQAKRGEITKARYVKSMIHLEAEAVYFRCKVFREFGVAEKEFPCKKDYISIYDDNILLPNEDAIKIFARYILESSIVKREFSAKKYYADCYDFYAGKKKWPSFYDERSLKEVLIADYLPENNHHGPKNS